MRNLVSITLLLALTGTGAQAELYKRVDEQGNVSYGDQPGGQAKPVQPGGLTTYSPPTQHREPIPAASKTDLKKTPGKAALQYTELVITSPGKDETVRSTVGDITVKTRATPALAATAGHHLVVLVDQKPMAKVAAAEAVLKNVDRGTHTLRAQITDASGKILVQSDEATIHLHRKGAANITCDDPRMAARAGCFVDGQTPGNQ